MGTNRQPFPLVADDEPVIYQQPQKALYTDEELITNSQGYADKNGYDSARLAPLSPDLTTGQVASQKSYADEARQKAREDLHYKRQQYFNQELKRPHQTVRRTEKSQSPLDKTQLSKKQHLSRENQADSLSSLADKLRQDQYILVDLPKRYRKPKNTKQSSTTKNNYDFLKRSQIYNYTDHQKQRDQQVARELNLTRFEE